MGSREQEQASPSLHYELHDGFRESSAPGEEVSSSSDDDEELRALFLAEKEGRPAAEVLGRKEPAQQSAVAAANRQSAMGRAASGESPALKAAGETLAALDALLDEAGSLTTARASAPTHDTREDLDVEDSQREDSQHEFVHDGVTYLRNGYGEVTNPETDERVGEWERGAIEWDSEEAKEQHEAHIDFRPAKRRRAAPASSHRSPLRRPVVATAAVTSDGGAVAEVIDCDEAWNAIAAGDEEEALQLSLRPAAEVFSTTDCHERAKEMMARDEQLARQIQEDWNRRAGQSQEAAMRHQNAAVDDETIARRLHEELNRGGGQSVQIGASQFQHGHSMQSGVALAGTVTTSRAAVASPVLQVKFLTYNLWFDESNREGRMAGILGIIQKKNPHIVAFQEMIPEFVALLKPALDTIGYRMELQNSGRDPYFVGLAVRTPLKFESITFDPFPNSQMGRGLLWGLITGPAGTSSILAGSVHLESWAGPNNPGTRQRQDQLHRCLTSMNRAAMRHQVGTALVLGDMNWNDKTDGDMGKLLQAAEEGSQSSAGGWNVRDIWTELRPDQQGWTYDGKANCMLANSLQGRFDRAILLSNTSDAAACGKIWKPSSIGMCGKQTLPGLHRRLSSGRTLPVLPSDHFGVLGVLKRADLSSGSSPASAISCAHSAEPVNSNACRQGLTPFQVSIRLVMPGAVLLSGRQQFVLSVRPRDTIGTLRQQISDQAGFVDVVDQVKLILLGVMLEPHADDRTVVSVGIQEGTEIVGVLPARSDTVLLKVKLVINSSEMQGVNGSTEMETQIEVQKTVADLKHKISAEASLTSRDQLTLIYDGKALTNDHTKLRELRLKHSAQVVAVVAAKRVDTTGVRKSSATLSASNGGPAAAAAALRGRAYLQSLLVAWDRRSSQQTVQEFCLQNPPSTTSGTPDGWIWLFSDAPSRATQSKNCMPDPDYQSILAPLRDANRAGRPRKKKEKDRVIMQLLEAAKSAGETSGKFILMPHSRHADEAWRLVATLFADGKLGHTAKISSADQAASAGGGVQQASTHVICVYVDIFDVSMVTRCAKELFSLNSRLPSGCRFSGKIKPNIFTTLRLNANNDCKLPVTLSAFYSPVLSEEGGEKVRALLDEQVTAPGRGAAASREPVRDLLTEIVGMKHAVAERRPELVCKLYLYILLVGQGRGDRSGGSGPGELTFIRNSYNAHDANAVEVKFDGIRVGYLPKNVSHYLAPAIDAGAVTVSLKMDSGAWHVNSSMLDELRKLRQDPNRRVPSTCNVHLAFKIDAGAEVASQLAVSQLHDGLDRMPKIA